MFESLESNYYFVEAVKFLTEKNLYKDSYLVGGSVRDLLLNREIRDIDFAVKGNTIQLAKEFSKKIGGHFVLLDEVFSIGRIVKDNVTIDFAKLTQDSIEEDLRGRDFTINAIAVTLSFDRLIDPFGGIKDLENRLIKMIREENLKADPLRILRAYRFHATLNFDIESNTHEALKRNAHLMKITAKERIKEELSKILSVKNSLKTVEIMVEDQIFKSIFKISDLISIKPDIQGLRIIEELLNEPNKLFKYLRISLNPKIMVCLKFAGIFKIYARFLIKQLKPSKKEEKFIEKVIQAGENIKKVNTLLDRVRFIRNYEDILYPALIYCLSIDPLGSSRAWFYKEIEEFYKKLYLKNKKRLPLIKGDELISLGYEPSPLIGKILDNIETLVLAGKISKKEEALEEIRKSYFSKISPK